MVASQLKASRVNSEAVIFANWLESQSPSIDSQPTLGFFPSFRAHRVGPDFEHLAHERVDVLPAGIEALPRLKREGGRDASILQSRNGDENLRGFGEIGALSCFGAGGYPVKF